VGVHNAIWIGAFGSGLPFLFVLLSPARSVAPSNGPSAQAIFDLTGYFVPAGG
jgi:hypothetical protein